jgi:hypothetical protein
MPEIDRVSGMAGWRGVLFIRIFDSIWFIFWFRRTYSLLIEEPRPLIYTQILRIVASFGIVAKNMERFPLYTYLSAFLPHPLS